MCPVVKCQTASNNKNMGNNAKTWVAIETWVAIGNLHIPDLFLKLYVFDICFSYELFPLRQSKTNFIIIFLKAIYIYIFECNKK